MNGSNVSKSVGALFASFFVVAMVTTFVLPNRPTPTVIKAFFEGLTAAIKSTIGVATPVPQPSRVATSQRLIS